MSDDVLICPNCRARVFGSWQACKFCGNALRVGRIDATVHPDDLSGVAPVGASDHGGVATSDAGPSGPRSPWGGSWSSWAGSGGGDGDPADRAPDAGGGWDSPAPEFDARAADWSALPAPGEPSQEFGVATPAVGTGFEDAKAARALIPLEGADPTWVPGPAPTVTGDTGASTGGDDIFAAGPAGLEPVSWYPEPGTSSSVDDTGVDAGPAGLEPVSWYPEPGTADAAGTDAAGTDTGGTDTMSRPVGSGPAAGTDVPGSGFGGSDGGFGAPDSGFGGSDGGFGAPGSGFGGSEGFTSGAAGTAFDTSASSAAGEMSDRFDPNALFDPPPTDASEHFDPPAPDGSERFDPSALFADPPPPPPTDSGFGQDLEPVAPGGELAVNWQPAAADAWDTAVEPEGKPKRQAVLSREARLLLAGIVVVLFVLVAAIALRDRNDSHPAEWAANVQQMADWVSKTRKVPFEHPVAVVTLSGSEYDAAVQRAGVPDKTRVKKELTDQVAMWRALAAVQGDPSAERSAVAAQSPELGAFYDIDGEQLVLRGGADLATLRNGLAGALSVALDDQRADLSSLGATGISEDPRFDVVLGTATLMRTEYVRQNSEGSDAMPRSDTLEQLAGQKLDFMAARRELRSNLGDPFAQLVRDVRGVATLNGLLASPPVSSQQIMLPTAYFDGRGALSVPQPEAPEGTEKLAEGVLGAQTWYLLVAAHLQDATAIGSALDFADRWAGDAYVAYRKPSGQVCVTDVIRGSDETQAAVLAVTLQSWKSSVAGGQIDITAEGTDITVSGCDPGASVDRGLGTHLPDALTAAVTRSELASSYYLAGTKIPNGVNGPVFSPTVAWCMGDEAVALAQPAQWMLLAQHAKPDYRDLTLAAASRCNSNMADQLFVERGD